MPAGFVASDFYYLLPELVLTAGALACCSPTPVCRAARQRRARRG